MSLIYYISLFNLIEDHFFYTNRYKKKKCWSYGLHALDKYNFVNLTIISPVIFILYQTLTLWIYDSNKSYEI